MSNFLLEIDRIRVNYLGGYTGIKDVSLKLPEGVILTVYGREGAGKTTLLRAISGLEKPDEGAITLNGKDLFDVSAKERNIGYTFSANILDGKKRVKEILSYPMKLRKTDEQEIENRVENLCREFGLDKDAKIKDLSGYDTAKLILARLFSVERDLYLIDDLTYGLDEEEKEKYYSVLKAVLKSKLSKKSAIVATRDKEFARTFGKDLLLVLHDGAGCGQSSLEEMQKRPSDMTSAELCGYELYTGTLTKADNRYFALLDEDGKRGETAEPLSGIYVDKRVCFALKNGQIMPFYYDLSCERIISKQQEII